jgi:3-hydroxybutyryl-CoA dehydrogenase
MAEIACLAIIGAGHTGRDIALVAALAGYRTILEDVLPASLQRAENGIRGQLDRSFAQGRISLPEFDAVCSRLEYSSSLEEAARQADLVLEAVPDEMESKLEIFALLDRIAKPHTILASTTSTLSIAEIASTTYRADRILGFRFFPSAEAPERLDRLEIVRAAGADDQAVAACTQVARRMADRVFVVTEAARD